MPTWVRQPLEDVVGVLTDRTDRTRATFRDLGVGFTLHPVGRVEESPYYRAEGGTDIANLIAGQFAVSATGRFGGIDRLQKAIYCGLASPTLLIRMDVTVRIYSE